MSSARRAVLEECCPVCWASGGYHELTCTVKHPVCVYCKDRRDVLETQGDLKCDDSTNGFHLYATESE